jgi:LmbE family N-acetylglucosaminyl deacetylase
MVIIAVGAHPDDAEDGCGGTVARLTLSDVSPCVQERAIMVYVTSGGAGIAGKTQLEASLIREQEAKRACEILHTEPIFLRLLDGDAFPTKEAVKNLKEIFSREQPRAIFTHWPLDTHQDHRATFFLVLQAYHEVWGRTFLSTVKDPLDFTSPPPGSKIHGPAVFFWQTRPYRQSMNFESEIVIGIDQTFEYKIEALQAHQSQNPGDKLGKDAEINATDLAKRLTTGLGYAEGFKRLRWPDTR